MNKNGEHIEKSEKYLKEMLSYAQKNEPSIDFSEKVMKKIYYESKVAKKGMFENKKFWITFLLTFSVILILSAALPDGGNHSYNHSLSRILNHLFSYISEIRFPEIPVSYVAIVISVVFLLFTDKIYGLIKDILFFRKKFKF